MLLYADDDEDDEQKDKLLSGSIDCAVVDSGCTKSVCGNIWLNTYIDSLRQKERKLIYTENSICQFRFGIGKVYTSNRIVHIPVHIGASCASLAVHVVPCNIPLLLSRISLKNNPTYSVSDARVIIEARDSFNLVISLQTTSYVHSQINFRIIS